MTNNDIISLLYVDDEQANLFLFKVSFEANYKVYTANSGESALDILKSKPDEIIVVISDMRMPRMNGVEFITKAKKQYQNIIYFILTGFEFNDEIDQALKSNLIQKYFTKPFDTKEINQAIENSIAQL
ncbi:MAG: two-component system response regulator (stage 0 sporulation protein F) [Cyclobacteriaceae bacterium]|jgi:two-component system response regulator (stage 0 sporulation protein F)